MNSQNEALSQQRESEWREQVSNPAHVSLVAAAADPQSRQAPSVKLWHGGKVRPRGPIRGGHFAGAAVNLSLRGGTNIFGPSKGATIELELAADPRTARAGVDSPPVPWLAHKVLCGGCGAVISVRGDRLLQGALAALNRADGRPLVPI